MKSFGALSVSLQASADRTHLKYLFSGYDENSRCLPCHGSTTYVTISLHLPLLLTFCTAFGEVNSIVREVAQARGQAIVNWDFE